jgi:hypothetical protein
MLNWKKKKCKKGKKIKSVWGLLNAQDGKMGFDKRIYVKTNDLRKDCAVWSIKGTVIAHLLIKGIWRNFV